ncbi:MAG: hypothetical protein J0H97_22265 [Alphaproteobacteria bacterium]|nr:hypothetical protein [Alphaproteobacteria bacterium]
MLTRDEIEALPDDPYEGFVAMVDFLNQRLEVLERWNNWHARRYFEAISAFLDEHGLRGAEPFERLNDDPPNGEGPFSVWWTEYSNAVSYAQVRISLRLKRGGSLSVILNNDHRKEIGALLTKIRAIVPKLEVTDRKRDAIYARIGQLQTEVEKSKTNLEAFFALTLDTADTLGQAGTKAKPFLEALERLKKIFSKAKSEQQSPSLPAPSKQKRLEPPKPSGNGLDDDIPF